jgi:hypothetical protein
VDASETAKTANSKIKDIRIPIISIDPMIDSLMNRRMTPAMLVTQEDGKNQPETKAS